MGRVTSISADFGFISEYNPAHRLFKHSLGRGSVLDIGISPIFMAISILGKPETIKASATFFETGADSSVDMTFNYAQGIQANLKSTLLKETPTTATITYEKGSIVMHSRFHTPTSVTVHTEDGSETLDFPTNTNGYHYEILHFNHLIREGKLESDLMSFNMSRLLNGTMDRVKEKIGLSYSS